MTRASHAPKLTPHTFTVRAPQAKEVCLAGSFNNWQPRALPMRKAHSGDWATTVDLKPGRHEYKFVVDGRWCCEPGADEPAHTCSGCVPNGLGTMNRVVEIK